MRASPFIQIMFCATIICSSYSIAQEQRSNAIPPEYVANFQDYVPGLIGQTIPNESVWVKCSNLGMCTVKLGGSTVNVFGSVSNWEQVKIPNAALDYARKNKVVKPSSPMAWYAQNLKPLLDSNSSINHCITLHSATMNAPPGFLLLCRLDKNPWEKDVVLFMGALMANCGDLFCGYEIYPMFRQEK